MTTIAYRNGQLAADTQMCVSGSIIGKMIKIVRRTDGTLAGAAGNATYSNEFLKWVLEGEKGNLPKAECSDRTLDRGVIFRPEGDIIVFEAEGSFKVQAEYYAFGSGMDYALGAMQVGASAERAVSAAIAHDPNSGGEVTTLTH
jgi:ATP-dependent HslUV protease subunit HslV